MSYGTTSSSANCDGAEIYFFMAELHSLISSFSQSGDLLQSSEDLCQDISGEIFSLYLLVNDSNDSV